MMSRAAMGGKRKATSCLPSQQWCKGCSITLGRGRAPSQTQQCKKIADNETGKSCWAMTEACYKMFREGSAHITRMQDYKVSYQYAKYELQPHG